MYQNLYTVITNRVYVQLQKLPSKNELQLVEPITHLVGQVINEYAASSV